MLNLLDSFGKKGVSYGIYTAQTDVVDTTHLSQFFIVSEFNPTFTAGKNAFSFNGSSYLQSGSVILIECLDSAGNNLFIEMAKYSTNSAVTYAYKEATAFVFSIHVYGDTADGVGKIMLMGTLSDGKSVKWINNIYINKTFKNESRIRFYQKPYIEVDSVQVPVLTSSISMGLLSDVSLSGSIQGFAVTPSKGINLNSVNKKITDIDYQLTIINPKINNTTPEKSGFNSQMIGSTINLNINQIQSPTSQNQIIPIVTTASYIISNVIDNETLQINIPYYYPDFNGNNIVTNIVDADFSTNYQFVNYNNSSSIFQKTTTSGSKGIRKKSYADVTYSNIRPFSGYVGRYKIYRKSLLTNADFSIVADSPVPINEILQDNVTQNTYYNLLGKFYNQQHISNYWFTSSNNLSMMYSPNIAVDSAFVSSPIYNSLSGSDYLMVKNNSISTNRNAVYIPFNMNQFLAESGSSYDSNFMAFKANVQYIIGVSAIIYNDPTQNNAGFSLYITGSYPNLQQEPKFTSQHGVNIATITASKVNNTSTNINNLYSFFVPQNDLYGTLVIVPLFCKMTLENISIRVYGDDGFSPDTFSVRIPWDISVANEIFQIKSELFDINNKIAYSDLTTIQAFDPSGSTLIV